MENVSELIKGMSREVFRRLAAAGKRDGMKQDGDQDAQYVVADVRESMVSGRNALRMIRRLEGLKDPGMTENLLEAERYTLDELRDYGIPVAGEDFDAELWREFDLIAIRTDKTDELGLHQQVRLIH